MPFCPTASLRRNAFWQPLSPPWRRLLAACLPLLAALPPTPAAAASTCALRSAHGAIAHVIHIQFDNTHLRRDVPDVPSDLEQMPSLLDFIRENGTLIDQHHTILISHTAGGMLSTLTGLYPDRLGQAVSNGYVRMSRRGDFSSASSFAYWSDTVSASDTPVSPNLVGADGRNVPAPWVAYTRAGCDVGAVASTNLVLENIGTGPGGDITRVFGRGSPQFRQAEAANAAPRGAAERLAAQADFVGLAIHCAAGSALCAAGPPDTLPDEPGGYRGFRALFGAQAIHPLLADGSPALADLSGRTIANARGHAGFPGFDGMTAAVSLAYVAALQEHGVPVTYAYISDAHDVHESPGGVHAAYGPGAAGYVRQLKAYDAAFAAFFRRLAAAGITQDNTLFVFTADEGDHYVGVRKPGCDGVDRPCVYAANETGEILANVDTLIAEQFPPIAARFQGPAARYAAALHGDVAPPFHLAAKGIGPLAQDDPATRALERALARLTAVNPYTGAVDRVAVALADHAAMKSLHMLSAGDPARNPTFVLFADPDYFLVNSPASACRTCINPSYAWNHGGIQPEIATTWLGLVGPGIRQLGVAPQLWTDHTDVRPTMLGVLGLHDDYRADGRIVIEALADWALRAGLMAQREAAAAIGRAYKQIQAPFGRFAANMLAASTVALASGSERDDRRYAAIERAITQLTAERDALAQRTAALLDAAQFDGQALDPAAARELTAQAMELLRRSDELVRRTSSGNP